MAHRLARRENRTIADVVERALESYEVKEAGREPAASFYVRLTRVSGVDVDFEALIKSSHKVQSGPEL